MKEEIISNWELILQKYNRYYGTSPYFILFIVSIIAIFAISKKKEKNVKTLLVFLPIVLLVIVFNPLFFKAVAPFVDNGGTYWRFFWLLPLAPVMGYIGTILVEKKENKYVKIFMTVCLIGILFYSGRCVFNSNNYIKVNNWYKMPNEIYEAVKIIQEDKEEYKKAMVPIDMAPWVRQLDGTIIIEFNRNPSEVYDDWINEYNSGVIDKNMPKLLNDKCNYLVVNNIIHDCDLESYGYYCIGGNDKYLIYKKI